jgi:hypothetical protein
MWAASRRPVLEHAATARLSLDLVRESRTREDAMTVTENQSATEPATAPLPAARPSLSEQLGGPWGMVATTVPVVVFVAANAAFPLPVAIAVAVGAAVVLTVVRLLRGERFSSAIGGVIGVGAAAGVAAWTGSASGFFLLGIWAALAGFVVTAASLVVRRPLTGIVWNAVHGSRHAWRDDRPTLRAHDLATAAGALVFGARFAVSQWLYLADSTGGLAVAKIAMGTPLTVLAALVVVWAFRRSSARLIRTGR